MQVIAISDDVLRVRVLASGEAKEDFSWAIPEAERSRSVNVNPQSAAVGRRAIEFKTASIAVRIEADPLRLIVSDLAGRPITTDSPQRAVDQAGRGFVLRKVLPISEHYFGLGDKTGPLDHRGQAFVNWNTDSYGFQESTDPLYKSIPFFVAAGGPAGSYGLFLDNTWRSWFDFGKRDPQTLEIGSSGGAIDYYVIYGPSIQKVIERYADLTGKSPLPPLWSLGFQQSRYSYMSSAEVRSVAGRLRAERIPADVIWLDIDYQDRKRPFTTNSRTFGDLSNLTADLRREGFRLVTIADLHVAFAPNQGYGPYDSGVAGDHFVQNPDGSTYVGEVWPGPSVFPDFTRSSTRAWWGDLYRDFVAAGVSGFWNDMNEPSVFMTPTKTMPLDVQHRIEEPGLTPRIATHEEVHNIYGMQNTRATFEGLRQLNPNERPFVMTRATYAGGQRYAVTWTGDNSATWNHLNLAISALLNLGMSGFSYSGADVGGFIGNPSADLLTKWIEVATFTPIFRIHSAKETLRREPWVDGPEQTNIRRRFIEERYRLLPYLYALADENTRTGVPLMRPVFFEFPDMLEDSCASPNAFMLGSRILVAPPAHFESPSSYTACLPSGTWFDYWTGRRVNPASIKTFVDEGDTQRRSRAQRLSVTPKLSQLPVFVRAGAILARQPLVQSTAQVPQGPLMLDVYPGDECRGTLYTDDGHSLSYREGAYFRQNVRCRETENGLVLEFEAPQGQMTPWWLRIKIRIHDWKTAARIDLDGGGIRQAVPSKSQVLQFTIDAPRSPARFSIDRRPSAT